MHGPQCRPVGGKMSDHAKRMAEKRAAREEKRKGQKDGGREKRAKPRIELKISISISFQDQYFLGEVFDINTKGVGFISNNYFAEDAQICLIFPGDSAIEKNDVQARILRCDKVAESSYISVALIGDENLRFIDNINALR